MPQYVEAIDMPQYKASPSRSLLSAVQITPVPGSLTHNCDACTESHHTITIRMTENKS